MTEYQINTLLAAISSGATTADRVRAKRVIAELSGIELRDLANIGKLLKISGAKK